MKKLCKEFSCLIECAPGRSRCWRHYGVYRRASETRRRYPDGMRILFIDLETSPNLVYTWGLFNQNIGINQIVKPTEILCFAAMWYGEEDTMFYSGWEHGQDNMVQKAWDLLNEANVVIHFYGSRFDIPHLNREFLLQGLAPPKPYKQIDLKMAVSKSFKFTSNKLQFVSEVLGLEGKIEHEGFGLWDKVMNNDENAQERMRIYNERDVTLLVEVYEILLPWIANHTHRHLYQGTGCPTCGAEDFVDAGLAYTKLSVFKQYQCVSCKAYFRDSRRISGVKIQESVL